MVFSKAVVLLFFLLRNYKLFLSSFATRCALGVYAHRLGKRIMKSSSFVNSLRLHSKTVFKIPAILLVVVLSLAVVSISNYG